MHDDELKKLLVRVQEAMRRGLTITTMFSLLTDTDEVVLIHANDLAGDTKEILFSIFRLGASVAARGLRPVTVSLVAEGYSIPEDAEGMSDPSEALDRPDASECILLCALDRDGDADSWRLPYDRIPGLDGDEFTFGELILSKRADIWLCAFWGGVEAVEGEPIPAAQLPFKEDDSDEPKVEPTPADTRKTRPQSGARRCHARHRRRSGR